MKTWVGQQRPAETRAHLKREDGTIWSPPSNRRIARMMTTDVAGLDIHDAKLVAGLLSKAPALADTVSAARRLALLLRQRSEELLATVLEAAGRTLLQPFVATLRKDLAAVQAALELPWTTSPVKGQISRLKMIKRTTYGRAGFSLLRARMLNPSSSFNRTMSAGEPGIVAVLDREFSVFERMLTNNHGVSISIRLP